jgi:hypothetical protein
MCLLKALAKALERIERMREEKKYPALWTLCLLFYQFSSVTFHFWWPDQGLLKEC